MILIVTALFPPEPLVSARTSADLADALHGRGHQVQVIAPYPSRPAGRRYAGYRRRLYWGEKSAHGYVITRCLAATSASSRLLSRMMENLTFGISAAWRVLWQRPKPDCIYANTWPLLASGLLALVVRLRRIALVLSVQDLYPEALVVQRRWSAHSYLVRLLLAWDASIARSSTALVVVNQSWVETYKLERKVPSLRIHVVPNWTEAEQAVDGDELAARAWKIRKDFLIPPDGFLMVYAGNVGAAAGVEGLVRAMGNLTDNNCIDLLIAGQGAQLQACRELAVNIGLSNIHFVNPWMEADTTAVLAAADLLLLPTQGGHSMVTLPSKLLNYLQAARPILATAIPGSELANIIAEAGCGWVISPDDPVGLAAAMECASDSSLAARLELGRNGLAYSRRKFSRQTCLGKLVQIIEDSTDHRETKTG